jgi:hypothetical protein
MQARSHDHHGPPDTAMTRQRLARITGVLYLALALCGMFAPTVLEALVAPGDAAATADNILGSRWLFGGSLVTWIAIVLLDAALAVTLSLLLAPTGRALALVTAALRLVYTAMLATILLDLYDAFLILTRAERGAGLDMAQRQNMALASLNTFSTGFLLALVFFGVHLIALGVAFHRARSVPRAFGLLLVAAGIGYIADSLASIFVAGHGGLVSALLLAPAIVGELGLTAWLLIKGVRVGASSSRNDSFGTHITPADARVAATPGGLQ